MSPNQSSFKQGHSCINQLLSTTHDISKAFDKVWHKALIHKLEQNGIRGPVLKILTDFLKSRKQSVVLNGQHLLWSDVLVGVPQGPLLVSCLYQ